MPNPYVSKAVAAALSAAALATPAAAEGYFYRAKAALITDLPTGPGGGTTPAPVANLPVVASLSGPTAAREIGGAWSFAFEASGGDGDGTFELDVADGLTGPLASLAKSVSGNTLTLSGSVAAPGTYPVRVTAKGSDGKVGFAVLTVTVRPSVMPALEVHPTYAHSFHGATLDFPEQAKWHSLYDGKASSGFKAESGWPASVSFDRTVRFDKVFMSTDGPGRIEVQVAPNSWVTAGSHQGGEATVTLDKTYEARGVQFVPTSGVRLVGEMRVGDAGTVSLPSLRPGAPAHLTSAQDTIERSLFVTNSHYDPSEISLSGTPTVQNGVTLEVSAERVRVVSRPTFATNVMVVARTPDGLQAWTLFRVEAEGSKIASTPHMTGAHSFYGSVKATAEQPNWHVLNDGNASSWFKAVARNPASVWGAASAFDRVRISSDSPGRIQVMQGSTWVDAGRHEGGQAVVVLRRAFVASNVQFEPDSNSIGNVYELSVGDAPVPALPSLSGAADAVLKAGTDGIDRSAFTSGFYWPSSQLSLADTPPKQSGVTLEVSAERVRVVDRPEHSVDVALAVKAPDGLVGWVSMKVEGASGETRMPLPTSASSYFGSTKAQPSQSSWNVLYDGNAASWFLAAARYEANVNFNAPTAFDRVRMSTEAPGIVLVLQGSTWVEAARHAGGDALVTLRRPFVSYGVQFRPDGSSNTKVFEMRVGDAPVQSVR